MTADVAVVTDKKLSQTNELFLSATVKNTSGAIVGDARVKFSLDSSEAVLVPSSGVALTGSSTGVALIKVAPAFVGSQGVVAAKATTTLNGTEITKEIYLNIAPGTVQLQNMQVNPGTLQNGQSLVASVDVLVNDIAATSNSVSINFSSTCGTAAPTAAVVEGNGKASAVIQTTQDGSCIVTASYNSIAAQKTFTVNPPPTTGIQFVSASPEKIYQSGSTGLTTSVVRFKVIDSLGSPVPSVAVSGALTNVDGGISFCGSPYLSLPTDSKGEVAFSVCSGTLPATVQVKASLDSAPTSIYTLSNLLTIQTGLPTQRFFDISATSLNFYAGGLFTSKFNGNEVEVTVYAADRQGNPIPAGTSIIFVAEGGQLITSGASSCKVGNNGRCSVKLVGQDYRPLGSSVAGADPRPGRVTVLAYTDGEESFVDANNNNRFDAGELFEDMGLHFIDKDEDGILTDSYTNLVVGSNEGESSLPLPAGTSGTTACPSNVGVGLSKKNSCNGVWDASTKVRRSIVIVFSGGEIGLPGAYDGSIPLTKQTAVLALTQAGANVRLADFNGNPLPSSTTLSTEVLGGGVCEAKLIENGVGASTEPTLHTILFDKCSGGEVVLFKAKVQDRSSVLQLVVP